MCVRNCGVPLNCLYLIVEWIDQIISKHPPPKRCIISPILRKSTIITRTKVASTFVSMITREELKLGTQTMKMETGQLSSPQKVGFSFKPELHHHSQNSSFFRYSRCLFLLFCQKPMDVPRFSCGYDPDPVCSIFSHWFGLWGRLEVGSAGEVHSSISLLSTAFPNQYDKWNNMLSHLLIILNLFISIFYVMIISSLLLEIDHIDWWSSETLVMIMMIMSTEAPSRDVLPQRRGSHWAQTAAAVVTDADDTAPAESPCKIRPVSSPSGIACWWDPLGSWLIVPATRWLASEVDRLHPHIRKPGPEFWHLLHTPCCSRHPLSGTPVAPETVHIL